MQRFEKIKKWLLQNYGVVVLLFLCLILSITIIVLNGDLYATLNDNFDSNVVIYKMAKDNNAFGNEAIALPYLGGKSMMSVRITPNSLPYLLFSPIQAYYICYIAKVLLSGLGFYFLAKKANKYSSLNLNENAFCMCGAIYGVLGTWPSAALGFALIPWWILVFYLLYKTNRIIYAIIPLVFAWTISLSLLGAFLVFYTIVTFVILAFKDKKFHWLFFISILVVVCGYYFLNIGQINAGMNGSVETIKSLAKSKYTDSVVTSLFQFYDKFTFSHQHHSGGADLRLFVIPICSIYFVVNIIRLIRKPKSNNAKASWIYIFLFLAIILNTLACCFDNNRLFRSFIEFASGFSFSRFAWLSPCIWLILFGLVCSEIKHFLIRNSGLLIAFILIALSPGYVPIDSLYNELYYNVSARLGTYSFPEGNVAWTWNEFFSESLFEEIKSDISYNGEWVAAYGLDPAVLQYNGFKTLDGYYSNYSLEYHDVFEKMIQPELDLDEQHRNYWLSSTGYRAYLYSPSWEFVLNKNTDIQEDYLYIDSNVFRDELGGKYIFSRVIIVNATELGLGLIGEWSNEESPYTIYVYEA